jgi:hypothetical protein
MTGQVTVGNRDQASFDAAAHPEFADGLLPGLTTWLLLHYWHEDLIDGRDEIRLELSVPVEFWVSSPKSGRGFIMRFAPRLILPSIQLIESAGFDEDQDEGGDEIDIEINRR